MIAPSPHLDVPCSLLSHGPPPRARGATENNETREARKTTENMAT